MDFLVAGAIHALGYRIRGLARADPAPDAEPHGCRRGHGSPGWDAYRRLSGGWAFWGAVALLVPLAAMALMVLKPPIRGL
jgi:hypothetical protein